MSNPFTELRDTIEGALSGSPRRSSKRSSSPFVIRRRSPRRSSPRRSSSGRRSRSPRRTSPLRSSSPRRRSSSPRRTMRRSRFTTPVQSPRRSSPGSVQRRMQTAAQRLSEEASYATPIRRSRSRSRSSSPLSLASSLPKAAKAARRHRYRK